MRKVEDLGLKEVILCATKEERILAQSLMHYARLKWNSGDSYLNDMEDEYLPNHCFFPKEGKYCSLEFYQKRGFTIYPLSDFIEVANTAEFRTFSTGGTRDTAQNKLEYSNYIHPICDYNYSLYMRSKQVIGGDYRRGNNRQLGLGFGNLFESLTRHIETVKLLVYGHAVYEYKHSLGVELVVDPKVVDPTWEKKELLSELNGCRFNSEGMKLELLLGRDLTTDHIKEKNSYPSYKISGSEKQLSE